MTETPSTTSTGAPVFPPGRYGHRREPRRRRPWLVAALAVAALAVATVIAVRLYGNYGDPAYDAKVITYTDITDTRIVVVFRVTVPADGEAVCQVRARSRDGVEVGRETVRVAGEPDGGQVTVTHPLATTARALLGEVPRCGPA